MSINALMNMVVELLVCDAQGRGRSNAISRSNSRNVIRTRKIFMEKSRHPDPIQSNPHS